MLEFGREDVLRVGDVYLKYHLFDITRPVVITFSHMTSGIDPEEISAAPSPWGFDFVMGRGFNIISFAMIMGRYNYYRDRALFEVLPAIGELLKAFPLRLGYGCSTGGYAVSAFSRPLNLDRVLLLCPISTRSRDINIWDFEAGRSLPTYDYDWEYPYVDGAEECLAPGYILYDPLYRLDRIHAERYSANKQHLWFPATGHLIPDRLYQLGILSRIFDEFVEDRIDVKMVREEGRKRRFLEDYYNWLLGPENMRRTPTRWEAILRGIWKTCPDLYIKMSAISINNSLIPGMVAADILRNIAITYENKGNLDVAKALMEDALRLRPEGEYSRHRAERINAKIAALATA